MRKNRNSSAYLCLFLSGLIWFAIAPRAQAQQCQTMQLSFTDGSKACLEQFEPLSISASGPTVVDQAKGKRKFSYAIPASDSKCIAGSGRAWNYASDEENDARAVAFCEKTAKEKADERRQPEFANCRCAAIVPASGNVPLSQRDFVSQLFRNSYAIMDDIRARNSLLASSIDGVRKDLESKEQIHYQRLSPKPTPTPTQEVADLKTQPPASMDSSTAGTDSQKQDALSAERAKLEQERQALAAERQKLEKERLALAQQPAPAGTKVPPPVAGSSSPAASAPVQSNNRDVGSAIGKLKDAIAKSDVQTNKPAQAISPTAPSITAPAGAAKADGKATAEQADPNRDSRRDRAPRVNAEPSESAGQPKYANTDSDIEIKGIRIGATLQSIAKLYPQCSGARAGPGTREWIVGDTILYCDVNQTNCAGRYEQGGKRSVPCNKVPPLNADAQDVAMAFIADRLVEFSLKDLKASVDQRLRDERTPTQIFRELSKSLAEKFAKEPELSVRVRKSEVFTDPGGKLHMAGWHNPKSKQVLLLMLDAEHSRMSAESVSIEMFDDGLADLRERRAKEAQGVTNQRKQEAEKKRRSDL